MPAPERIDAAVSGQNYKGGGSKDVADEHPGAATDYQGQASQPSQPQKLAENKGCHDPCLERSDATARVIHTHESIAQFDHIPDLIRAHADPARNFHRKIANRAHEVLDDGVLQPNRPWNRYERK